MVGKHDDHFFPNNTTVDIVHVMNLVENHKFDISYQVGSSIQHGPKNLGCHNQTIRIGIDLNITSNETNIDIFERFFEVTKLLIRQCFDGRGVDGFRHVSGGHRYGVLSYHSLTG